MATALYINSRRRDLQVFAVSVTTSPSGLVVRNGAPIGCAYSFGREDSFVAPCPIILPTKGYQAQSSEGFVEITKERVWRERFWVVGLQGFPWMSGTKSLRLLREPEAVVVLPTGTIVRRIPTGTRSNVAAAQAAREGLRLRAKVSGSIMLLEGQSDHVGGVEFSPSNGEVPAWPAEHQIGIFGGEAFVAPIEEPPALPEPEPEVDWDLSQRTFDPEEDDEVG